MWEVSNDACRGVSVLPVGECLCCHEIDDIKHKRMTECIFMDIFSEFERL